MTDDEIPQRKSVDTGAPEGKEDPEKEPEEPLVAEPEPEEPDVEGEAEPQEESEADFMRRLIDQRKDLYRKNVMAGHHRPGTDICLCANCGAGFVQETRYFHHDCRKWAPLINQRHELYKSEIENSNGGAVNVPVRCPFKCQAIFKDKEHFVRHDCEDHLAKKDVTELETGHPQVDKETIDKAVQHAVEQATQGVQASLTYIEKCLPIFPKHYRAFYDGCVTAGFSEKQSLELLKIQISKL